MADIKISQMITKATVVNTDQLPILDSADSFGNKKTTMGAIKALVIPSTADITGDTLITVGNGTNVALGSTSVTLTLDNDLSKYNNATSGFITSSDIPALPSNTDLSDYDNTTSSFATTTELSTALETKQDVIDATNKLDYDYLSNTPTIPTVNDATLTITQNGVSAGTFTANASSDVTIAIADAQTVVADASSTTATLALASNTLYTFATALTELTISSIPSTTYETEIQFITGETFAFTATGLEGKWVGGTPTFEVNKSYVIAIKNGIAAWGEIS